MNADHALLSGSPLRLGAEPDHSRDPRTSGAGGTSLRGTVALVTGGGQGLGLLIAHSLADAGAVVGLTARSSDRLRQAVDVIQRSGGTAAHVAADVTDVTELSRAIAILEERLGPIDLLVNNAGIVGPIGPLWQNDPDDWWATIDVNLRGVVLSTQRVLPSMIDRRRGRIINITSRAGTYRWPLVSSYSVSKAAVVKLSENLAHETRRYGVSVFSVHPGLLPIGLTETVVGDTSPGGAERSEDEDRIRRWALDELRSGRGADPERAAELILRIAAGDADPLSGRHLSVHDDLDRILARIDEVRERDLYVMRPDRLSINNHHPQGEAHP